MTDEQAILLGLLCVGVVGGVLLYLRLKRNLQPKVSLPPPPPDYRGVRCTCDGLTVGSFPLDEDVVVPDGRLARGLKANEICSEKVADCPGGSLGSFF